MKDIPAFPTQFLDADKQVWIRDKGMTLRDYFAAKAMQGMLSENSGIRYPTDELVDFSYKIADAMMKAREV
jgi:hypothetical protein